MYMDKIIKHKKAYMKALEDSIVGNELNTSFPNVDSTSPYFTELNEEQEITSFAYEMGNILKGKVGGGDNGDNGDGGVSTSHHHDDRYAKIVHNHDDRYYTKIEIDEWRDRLINGDLLFNKINANHIQAGTIVAGSTIIANGAIGSAQISKVSADKLDAGIIDTSRITIAGANGNLKLRGNRLQVFEGIGSNQYERVSLGDVNNDGTVYGLRVRGADGNTILYDENGVYREGITDGSITNDKIGDDANIDGGKLNIHSVITNINENNTGTIHGTKIDIDGESVTSKVYNIILNQNEHSESIERQQSEINQNREQIQLKVSNQKYTEDMSAMESRLERTESDISVLNESIKLTVTKTEVENQITEVKDFVSDEIGELSVGGANYLNNSAPRKAIVDEYVTWDRTLNGDHRLVYWQDYNDSVELPQVGYHPHIDLETFHFPCIALINRNATWNMANRALTLKQEIHKPEEFIIPNETYVISFDAYSDTSLFSFHGGLYHKNVESSNYNYHSGRMDISISEEHINTWKRYSFSFTTHKGIDTSQPMYLVINGHNNPEGSGYIKNIKLEKGVIVSQWTPSQFDVDDSLNDAIDGMKDYTNESIKSYNSSIEVKFDGITSRVDFTEKDLNNVKGSVSEISQKADSISSKVTDLSGKYTELKQTIDGFDITGKVSFYDLKTAGATIINGANITTGTIDTNRVNIKGGTTKKIVIANDNYCVYDGTETDVNRKVFIGFRTNTATNVPSVMLGYNGINPNVDGAVVSGGTYTTYSHYPNLKNPEDVNESYGALAFKYGAGANQFSTLNMYQSGRVDIKAGSSIYFRPNLRGRDNPVFAITDVDVGCRVPFKCTSTIYTNGSISTDSNIHANGNISASDSMSCKNLMPSNIEIGGSVSINTNGFWTSGHVTSSKIKTNNIYNLSDSPLFTFNTTHGHIDLQKNLECNFYTLKNPRLYNASYTYSIPSGYDVDVDNDVNIMIANEDIAEVTSEGEVTFCMDDMIKLLYKKISNQEKQIQILEKEIKIIKGEI